MRSPSKTKEKGHYILNMLLFTSLPFDFLLTFYLRFECSFSFLGEAEGEIDRVGSVLNYKKVTFVSNGQFIVNTPTLVWLCLIYIWTPVCQPNYVYVLVLHFLLQKCWHPKLCTRVWVILLIWTCSTKPSIL